MSIGADLRRFFAIFAVAIFGMSSAAERNQWVERADSVLFIDPYEAYRLYREHSPEDHLRIAESLLALGEIDSAITHLQSAGDYFRLGRAYYLKGDRDLAYSVLSELRSPRAQLLAGVCMEETEPSLALDHFERARNGLPEISDYLALKIAATLSKLGRPREALTVLTKAIADYPEMEERQEVAEELSGLYFVMDFPVLARKHLIALESVDRPRYAYSVAIIEEHMNWSPEENFRQILYEYPKTVWALQSFEQLAEGDREIEDYLYGGMAYSNFSEYEKARDCLKVYLAQRPDDGGARFELGLVHYNLRKYRDAYREFSRVAGDREDDAIFYCGRCRERMGEMDEALQEYGRVSHTSSRFPQASYYAGRLCEKIGRFEQAVRIYRALYRKRRDSSFSDQACFRSGFVLYSLEKLSEAAQELREFERLFPKSPYLDAALYWRAKSITDPEERRPVLDRLLRTNPQSYYSKLACDNFGMTPPQLKTEEALPLPDPLVYPSVRRGLLFLEIGLVQEASRELSRVGDEHNSLLSAIYNRYPVTSKAIGYAYRAGGGVLKLLYPRTHMITLQRVSADPFLMLALVREESRFDPFALSRAGAVGLAQIMPETGAMIAGELDYEPFHTDDLLNPEVNLRFGSFYLDKMLARFGQLEYALAAYNAGPHRVTKWLSELGDSSLDLFVETIPFSETRKYTKRVLASYWNYTRIYASSSAQPSNQSNE